MTEHPGPAAALAAVKANIVAAEADTPRPGRSNLTGGSSPLSSSAAAGQQPDARPAVQLIAVTKTYPAEAILPVLEAGHRSFGENRVQEAAAKWPALREAYPAIELHLIGPLQSNKVRQAVALFDVIHTVDRAKIATAIAAEIAATRAAAVAPSKPPPRLFVQVNTGEEPQKAGVAPLDTVAFVAWCRDDLGLAIDGLMCIPPVDEEPAVHFALLADLAAAAGVAHLSMGMSSDYEIAIQFGATHVRVGSAIFGART